MKYHAEQFEEPDHESCELPDILRQSQYRKEDMPQKYEEIFRIMSIVSHPALEHIGDFALDAWSDGMTKSDARAITLGLMRRHDVVAEFYKKRLPKVQTGSKMVFN